MSKYCSTARAGLLNLVLPLPTTRFLGESVDVPAREFPATLLAVVPGDEAKCRRKPPTITRDVGTRLPRPCSLCSPEMVPAMASFMGPPDGVRCMRVLAEGGDEPQLELVVWYLIEVEKPEFRRPAPSPAQQPGAQLVRVMVRRRQHNLFCLCQEVVEGAPEEEVDLRPPGASF